MNKSDVREQRSIDKPGAEQPLRILHLEDKTNDHELVREHLKAHGFQFNILQAKTRGDFVHALEQDKFNLVLSDFSMPAFSGIDALGFARETSPETIPWRARLRPCRLPGMERTHTSGKRAGASRLIIAIERDSYQATVFC